MVAKQKIESVSNINLSDKCLIDAYREMLLIRRFEERAGQLYGLGQIGGFCHLYSGQEAVIVGTNRARCAGDQMITAYRDHGHLLVSGMHVQKAISELLGRHDGVCKGKGGSMHLFNVDNHFYGGHGIVGAQVSIGTGIAFANAYRRNNAVCLTFFGDGAANQGQVYESFNMAALWKLPVLYIIENNEYAMGTRLSRASAQTNLSQRGVSLGIEGRQVNGMDVEVVYQEVMKALLHIRSGAGPFILEMKTYRYSGHSMSDPAKYRKREEVKDVRKMQDPIHNLQKKLVEKGVLNEKKVKKIQDSISEKIEMSVENALKSRRPHIDELTTDIYAELHHAS